MEIFNTPEKRGIVIQETQHFHFVGRFHFLLEVEACGQIGWDEMFSPFSFNSKITKNMLKRYIHNTD